MKQMTKSNAEIMAHEALLEAAPELLTAIYQIKNITESGLDPNNLAAHRAAIAALESIKFICVQSIFKASGVVL